MPVNVFGEPMPATPKGVDPLPGQTEMFDRWAWAKKKCRSCDEVEWTITPAGEFQCITCREKKRMATKAPKKPKSKKAEAAAELPGVESEPTGVQVDVPTEQGPRPGDAVDRVLMDIDCSLIDVVPGLNPRKEFDPEGIAELGESIKSLTQLAPSIVRPSKTTPGRFDMMGGERRLRAVRDYLKLPTLWCRVIVADEELQSALTDDENATQKPLNPIERAESLALRLKHSGLNQTAFAAKAGCRQGTISNTLRLLELPEPIRQLVISEKIAPAYARSLIPFLDVPYLTEAVCHQLESSAEELEPGETLTASDVRGGLIGVCRTHGRTVNGYYWDAEAERNLEIELGDDPSVEMRKRLDIRECPTYIAGKSELRAFNIPAWIEAQAEWEREEEARNQALAGDGESDDGDNSQGAGESVDVDRRTPEQKAKEYESDLRDYLTGWHQSLIAKWLPRLEPEFRTRLLLHFCITSGDDRYDELLLKDVLGPLCIELQEDADAKDPELLYTLSECNEAKLHQVTVGLLQRWVQLTVDKWASNGLTPYLLSLMVAELGIELTEHWSIELEFLSFHSDDQLRELAKEWRLKKVPTGDRDNLVKFLLDQVDLKPPARLLAIDLMAKPKASPAADTEVPNEPDGE